MRTREEKLQAASRLLVAAELLKRNGWCQGTFESPTGSYCMLGAVRKVTLKAHSHLAFDNYADCRRAVFLVLGHKSIDAWNDEPGRTSDEVIRALVRAADLLAREAAAPKAPGQRLAEKLGPTIGADVASDLLFLAAIEHSFEAPLLARIAELEAADGIALRVAERTRVLDLSARVARVRELEGDARNVAVLDRWAVKTGRNWCFAETDQGFEVFSLAGRWDLFGRSDTPASARAAAAAAILKEHPELGEGL